MNVNDRIELYCTWANSIAQNDAHGYSQLNRWCPDFDCSSFVISALEQAGFQMKKNGASYTGNMTTALLRCGFELVQNQTLMRGDILLTHNDEHQHTAIYLGNKKIVHARGANGHPEAGDQTGKEICVSDYYPFEHVFRYPHSSERKEGSMIILEEISEGSTGRTVKSMQCLLNEFGGYFLEVDGIAGSKSITALINYQKKNGLLADGICGVKTWSKLLKGA